jgi:ParB/RepB/Spo0J family partition protein
MSEVLMLDTAVCRWSDWQTCDKQSVRFSVENIESLAKSIVELGQQQPIIVRPMTNGQHEIVCGHRRFEACRHAGIQVKAIIQEFSEQEAAFVTIVENLQRHDISPLDEAFAFQRQITAFGYTIPEFASRIGKRVDYVQRRLDLLSLKAEIAQLVVSNHLPIMIAQELAKLPTHGQQTHVLKQYQTGKLLNVIEVKTVVNAVLASSKASFSLGFDTPKQPLTTQQKKQLSAIHRIQRMATALLTTMTTDGQPIDLPSHHAKQLIDQLTLIARNCDQLVGKLRTQVVTAGIH